MSDMTLRLGLAVLLLCTVAAPARAALLGDVNRAFRSVYGRNPTHGEWAYWAQRVQRREKRTFTELQGAMVSQKEHGGGATPAAPTSARVLAAAATGFQTDRKFYASPANPNALPDGTLVRSVTSPDVFYIRNGKRSWVLPRILDVWFQENHFFKRDIVLTISDSDLTRYPQTSSVNPLYIGKVLKHPDGTEFYIDDKLRKRKVSPAVRKALRFPSGNLYPTSAAHLRDFPTGPAITRTDLSPGGMVIYDGPFHGGRIWKIEEEKSGGLVKRLYLHDRLYEADGYPDESQRVGVTAATLARHPRGPNIDRYPDGWLVGLDSNIYVVQQGKLRLIASPELFDAMGYKRTVVQTIFPQFLRRYPHGEPIRAFKSVVAGGAAATKGAPRPAPNPAVNLMKVRPHVREMIANVNATFRRAFDRDPSSAENRFWVDFVYQGEVGVQEDLVAAMERARQTGQDPARTSRTATRPLDELRSKWFPYLFYFVHQSEPSEEARSYWESRIRDGDRDTIEKLGGTLQWLKDTQGRTHR